MTHCIFCRIIPREFPTAIEYEDQDLVIFRDIQPQAPNHMRGIPRRHIERISDLKDKDASLAGAALIDNARCFAAKQGWADYLACS